MRDKILSIILLTEKGTKDPLIFFYFAQNNVHT